MRWFRVEIDDGVFRVIRSGRGRSRTKVFYVSQHDQKSSVEICDALNGLSVLKEYTIDRCGEIKRSGAPVGWWGSWRGYENVDERLFSVGMVAE